MKDWIEARIKEGEYASTSDYVRDLVRRDRERRSHPELTMDDLRRIVDQSRASGVGRKSVSEVLAQAKKRARAGGRLNE
jgi:antitoxin ParD1/3/4